jgi:hypothetical protein
VSVHVRESEPGQLTQSSITKTEAEKFRDDRESSQSQATVRVEEQSMAIIDEGSDQTDVNLDQVDADSLNVLL